MCTYKVCTFPAHLGCDHINALYKFTITYYYFHTRFVNILWCLNTKHKVFVTFLPRDAVQPVLLCSVRPSIRPLRSCILSKRVNVSLKICTICGCTILLFPY